MIQKLKRKPPQSPVQQDEQIPKMPYSEKWPWIKKIQFAIEHEDRHLTQKKLLMFYLNLSHLSFLKENVQ